MKIAFITQPEYFRFMYENDLDQLGEIFEFPFHFGMDASEFEPLVKFEADYNFFFRGEFIPVELLDKMKGIKISLSSEPFPITVDGKLVYTLDSINRYDIFRSIRFKSYDYVFHYDAASLNFMQNDGLILSGVFPFPVATGSYFKKKSEKCWDIFFIGRSSVHREQFFVPLKHIYNFLHICHGIWGPALNHYINRSRICLNVHAEDEVSWEPRLQMLLATGAFVLSERISSNVFLRPGIDYIEANSADEMFELVSHYLNNKEEMGKIATSGRLRVLDVLDSKKCFPDLIEKIDTGKVKPFKTVHGNTINGSASFLRLRYRKVLAWLKQTGCF